MATKPIEESRLREVVEAVNQAYRDGYRHGASPSANMVAAQRLGIKNPTFTHYLRAAKQRLGIEPDKGLVYQENLAAEETLVKQEVDTVQVKVSQLERDLRVKAAAVTVLREQLADAQKIREMAFELSEAPVNVPGWVVRKPKKHKGKEIPVLFTSDFQYGEVVNPEELDGLNEFNVPIAEARYRTLIEKTIDLCFNHHQPADYPGIIYLRGGDAISGAIHDELAETDQTTPIESTLGLAEMEIWGIERLREKFGKVHVISIPGNHGRITKKIRKKKYVAHNLETLATAMIEKYFLGRGDGAVTFQTPPAGEAFFTVGKFNFVLTHGDRIGSRGGQGFIGPVAAVAKGIWKVRNQYAARRVYIHHVLMGHFHVRMDPQYGMVNGSLVGPSEYSHYEIRAEPEEAKQLLFFVHPEVGVTLKRDLILSSLGADFDNLLDNLRG